MNMKLISLPISLFLFAACSPMLSSTTGGGDSSSSEGVACTKEAKLCSDGSYVGRQGPNCEFTLCPGESSSASNIVSDGMIMFVTPATFGLALKPEQILEKSYIPQCEPGFTYCLYFKGTDYKGTNFDGAGFGISKRTSLKKSNDCIAAQPDGYSDLKPITRKEVGYETALYANLGDAGAGHFSHDRLYRLFVDTTCYEFRQRIGVSQFDNFEDGTLKEFNTVDEKVLQTSLDAVLKGVKFFDGRSVIFPDYVDTTAS